MYLCPPRFLYQRPARPLALRRVATLTLIWIVLKMPMLMIILVILVIMITIIIIVIVINNGTAWRSSLSRCLAVLRVAWRRVAWRRVVLSCVRNINAWRCYCMHKACVIHYLRATYTHEYVICAHHTCLCAPYMCEYILRAHHTCAESAVWPNQHDNKQDNYHAN